MKTIRLTEGDDLHDVLRDNREPGTVINLAPGTYPMPGNWGAGEMFKWCHVEAGVMLRGEDPFRRPVLRFSEAPVLKTGGKDRPDRDLTMLWCNGYPAKYRGPFDTTLENLVIDLRHAPEGWYTSGLRMYNRSVLRNIRILGVRGAQGDETTLSKDVESFAVSSTGNTGGSAWFGLESDRAEGYASGFFMGSTDEGEELLSSVAACCCELPPEGWFAFSGNQKVLFQNCQNTGGRVGFYNDWLRTEDIWVGDSMLNGSLAAVLVRPRAKDQKFSVRIQGGFLTGETAVGVDVGEGGDPVPGSIVVNASVIDANNLYVIRNTAAEVRFELCAIRREQVNAIRHGGQPPRVTGCYGYDRLVSTVH